MPDDINTIKTKYQKGDFIVYAGKQVVEVFDIVERGLVAWLVYPSKSHRHIIEWDSLLKYYQPLQPGTPVLGGYVQITSYDTKFFPNGPTEHDKKAMNKVKKPIDGD